jgi:hypothetical protein
MIGVASTGGTNSARYCYTVWLRHLVKAVENGLPAYPKVIAELGPGDSLGIGLAALLSGVEQYIALDVKNYAVYDRNLAILSELIELYKNRTPIPGEDEFPKVRPNLSDYTFPSTILDSSRMGMMLDPIRLEKIREALAHTNSKHSIIRYSAPWYDDDQIDLGSVDLLFSQAVLEHVDDLDAVYDAMVKWLKKNGYMSHTIDFSSHGLAQAWNGHWLYSDPLWALVRGKRPWLINRQPLSVHIELIERSNMSLVLKETVCASSKIKKGELAKSFRALSSEDLSTRGVYLLARKV